MSKVNVIIFNLTAVQMVQKETLKNKYHTIFSASSHKLSHERHAL